MDKSKQYISIPIEEYETFIEDYNTLKASLGEDKCIILYNEENMGMGHWRKGYTIFSKDDAIKSIGAKLEEYYNENHVLRNKKYVLENELRQIKIKAIDKIKWWQLW